MDYLIKKIPARKTGINLVQCPVPRVTGEKISKGQEPGLEQITPPPIKPFGEQSAGAVVASTCMKPAAPLVTLHSA